MVLTKYSEKKNIVSTTICRRNFKCATLRTRAHISVSKYYIYTCIYMCRYCSPGLQIKHNIVGTTAFYIDVKEFISY